MNFIYLILFAYIMGFVTAMPIGAVQAEIAKRSLSGNIVSAMFVAFASVSVDILYGAVAFFGIAPFLKDKVVISFFLFIGMSILLILSFLTIRKGSGNSVLSVEDSIYKNKRLSFLIGISLSATNPTMIFWWLAQVQFVKDLGIIDNFTTRCYANFLLFGGLGLASYLILLIYILKKMKHFISDKIERKINLILGILLMFTAFYFFIRLVKILL